MFNKFFVVVKKIPESKFSALHKLDGVVLVHIISRTMVVRGINRVIGFFCILFLSRRVIARGMLYFVNHSRAEKKILS